MLKNMPAYSSEAYPNPRKIIWFDWVMLWLVQYILHTGNRYHSDQMHLRGYSTNFLVDRPSRSLVRYMYSDELYTITIEGGVVVKSQNISTAGPRLIIPTVEAGVGSTSEKLLYKNQSWRWQDRSTIINITSLFCSSQIQIPLRY